MAKKNFLSDFILIILKKILEVQENPSLDLGNLKSILIVRQHNQLGDMLAGVSFLRALKEKYPDSKITIILSKDNFKALQKNRFVDFDFVFEKKKLFNPAYLIKFLKLLRKGYDVVFVPVTVSISFTSNFISRLSNAKIRVGPKSLNGVKNESEFFFDRRIVLDWRQHPDSHISDRIIDLLRPFGIFTDNFTSEINFDEKDLNAAENFLKENHIENNSHIIGLHVGAGKPQNRWPLQKYVELIEKLNNNFKCKFYLTGSDADAEELNYVISHSKVKLPVFMNKEISEVAALISISDLFITNDTGTMHIAGATKTTQISLFGPTNPYNWAPVGSNKFFIRKSDLMDDIEVEDVFELAEKLLNNIRKTKNE